ncbi:hypothetical protein AB0F91_31090 [Amycolatopsis sp. NPDC023774]|uniref:hypothetical protein n=1 Tax=Amycolatopsis sp. NPDC023774 TaxID=3155015 RepID=UPI0033C47B2F
MLELSPGSLTSLLGPRAPRGRRLGQPPDRVERRRLWPHLRPLTAELKPPPDGQLAFWSVHDRVAVDPALEYGRRFTRPVREYACQGQFGLRLPRQVRSFDRRGPDGPRHIGDPRRVGKTHAVTSAARDAGPRHPRRACWTW